MCAISGFLGKSDKNTARMLQHLSFFGEERGRHSSGIAIFQDGIKDKDYTGFMVKDTVAGSEMYKKHAVKSLIQDNNDTIILQHNRWATHGAITQENAHPFVNGEWLFTHNGVISNFNELQKANDTKFQVDSQIIGHLLNKYQSKERVFSKKLRGSFVIPFINRRKPFELYIMVHDNPVSVATKYDGSQLFYASLGDYLEDSLLLNDIDDEYEVFKLKDNTLYQFIYANGAISVIDQKIKIKKTYQSYTNYGSYGGGSSWSYTGTGAKPTTTKSDLDLELEYYDRYGWRGGFEEEDDKEFLEFLEQEEEKYEKKANKSIHNVPISQELVEA